jgi:mono/diheme cytochrome c family protein
MTPTRKLILAACMIAAAPSAAQLQPGAAPSRGELLYATHCIACHTTEVHWRQKRLAVDWGSLNQQVRRWAGNAGLGWSDDEIVEVARYLNAAYYRFEAPSVTGLGHRDLAPRTALAR